MRYKDLFDLIEGKSLDVKKLVTGEFDRLGIKHKWESSSKHDSAVYHLNNREHQYHVQRGKKGDGKIRQEIITSVRRHVRDAAGRGPDERNRSH